MMRKGYVSITKRLEESTRGGNSRTAKLDEERAQALLDRKGTQSLKETAKEFGVSDSTVQGIWSGKTWRHLKRKVPQEST